jgi:hypothetical protein
MDILGYGTRNADGPSGNLEPITVISGNLTNKIISMVTPTAPSLPPDTPQDLMVFPGDSAAVIMWKGDYTNNQDLETAEAYKIYWDTNPGFGSSHHGACIRAADLRPLGTYRRRYVLL